jgi:pimeloyl-ACP methyl ester carboxylesterase
MRANSIDLGGLSIEVLESNGLGDPVFLFHGNSGAASGFETLLSSDLGKRQKLVAVSFPGHGNSSHAEPPESVYTLAGLGEVAISVVRRYGAANYWMLGQSLGGHVLIESIRDFTNARGLILVAAPPISLKTYGQAFLPDPTDGCLFKAELSDQEVDRMATCMSDQANRRDAELLRTNIRCADPAFRACLGASLATGALQDELEAFKQLTIPVLLVAGGLDKFVNSDYYGSLPRQRSGHGRTIVFETAGHAVHLEDPARFEAVVTTFMAEAGQGEVRRVESSFEGAQTGSKSTGRVRAD